MSADGGTSETLSLDQLHASVGVRSGPKHVLSILVENKPGAGGRIAAELLTRATADGYTLLVAPAGTLMVAPAVYTKLGYDPLKSFELVSNVSLYAFILSVPTSHHRRRRRSRTSGSRSRLPALAGNTWSSGPATSWVWTRRSWASSSPESVRLPSADSCRPQRR